MKSLQLFCVLTFLVLCSTARAALVAHYKLDETSGTAVSDSAGTNNGTAGETIVSEATDVPHATPGITFNDSQAITLDSTITFTGNFTIAFFAKYTGTFTQLASAVGMPSFADAQIQFVGPSTAANHMDIYIENLTAARVDTGVTTSEWHHYALVRTGGDVALWVDGALVDGDVYGATDASGDSAWQYIGRDFTSTRRMIGPMADMRFYDEALDAAGIAAIFESPTTFLDREVATDIRIVSYNVFENSIFPASDPNQAAKFARVAPALDADIYLFQEISSTAAELVTLLNSIDPPTSTWHAYRASGRVIATRDLALSMEDFNPDPNFRSPAIALVDLPGDSDLFAIDIHFISGLADPNAELERQRNADWTIEYLEDGRTAGGSVTFPYGSLIVIGGDANNFPVGTPEAISFNTLVTGDITDNVRFGPDSPPDYGSRSLIEAKPSHNALNVDFWTADFGTGDSRIDHILYSDSTMNEANKFVLNTVAMFPWDLAAKGLEKYDVTLDYVGVNYDHLPVVLDFRVNYATPKVIQTMRAR